MSRVTIFRHVVLLSAGILLVALQPSPLTLGSTPSSRPRGREYPPSR